MCRLFETIIADKLLNHFINNNISTPHQYGFIPGRSTITQVMNILNRWHYCYVIYTDFAKGFDTVSHSKLLSVLSSYCMNASLIEWIYKRVST